jgi:hypothetical protein
MIEKYVPADTDLVRQPTFALKQMKAAVDHASATIARRAVARIGMKISENTTAGELLAQHGAFRVILAGGALLPGAPNDLDFFPHPQEAAAFTSICDGKRIATFGIAQFINVLASEKPATVLMDLVDNFDFAHCKVGVVLGFSPANNTWNAQEVYMAVDFVAAMLAGGTFYCPNTNGAMRSLARVAKVATKLGLTQNETHALAHQVAEHIKVIGIDAAQGGIL